MIKDKLRNRRTIVWLVVVMESNIKENKESFNKLWLRILLAFNKAKEKFWVRNKQVLTLKKVVC
jgi:predicted oxidoreductase (fatty acid repression mutant protein)